MRRILVLAGALASLAGACGSGSGDGGEGAGDASGGGSRTIEVTMRDIDFDPAAVTVRRGEEVRFVFENEGKLVHDAFIGNEAAQQEHEREVREAGASGGNGHGHGAGTKGISVDPGRTGELTHRFDEAGEVFIGCHEPGHYPSMRVKVTVA